MIEFEVYWYDEHNNYNRSKVYWTDPVQDRFLVVDRYGHFAWVKTYYCTDVAMVVYD